MLGTEDGFWYSFKEHEDGSCDWSFHQWGEQLAHGRAQSVAKMMDKFDAFVASRKLAA